MDFITAPEAAKRYGFNRRYIAEMCRKGLFGTAFQARGKFGKMEWFIFQDEIEQYAAETHRGPYSRKVYRVIRRIIF